MSPKPKLISMRHGSLSIFRLPCALAVVSRPFINLGKRSRVRPYQDSFWGRYRAVFLDTGCRFADGVVYDLDLFIIYAKIMRAPASYRLDVAEESLHNNGSLTTSVFIARYLSIHILQFCTLSRKLTNIQHDLKKNYISTKFIKNICNFRICAKNILHATHTGSRTGDSRFVIFKSVHISNFIQ